MRNVASRHTQNQDEEEQEDGDEKDDRSQRCSSLPVTVNLMDREEHKSNGEHEDEGLQEVSDWMASWQ